MLHKQTRRYEAFVTSFSCYYPHVPRYVHHYESGVIYGLVQIPKKGDLTKTDNYRDISLSRVATKIYNRCLLNRIHPVMDKVLRPNRNGFRKGRSTTSHIVALCLTVIELKILKMEAVI